MKKIRQTVLDGFLNVLTKIGVRGRDKRLGALPSPPINLSRGDLTNLYTADDIVARLCDLPAKTMTRKWLDISGVDDPTEAAAVISAGTKIGIRQATREAITWGRLYGSALVIMGVNDGREMNEPVDESNIKSIDYLLVIGRWDLQIRSDARRRRSRSRIPCSAPPRGGAGSPVASPPGRGRARTPRTLC